jgi:predicted dehydrogenase
MFLRGRYGHGGRLGYEKEWRADKSKSGGGELIDQGTHLIDLSIGFLGELKLDYAATPNYFWDMAVEDNVFISLKNVEGNIAFLHASCTEWKNMFSLEIYGKTGKIEISGLGRSYGEETLTFHKMLPEMGPPLTETWSFPEPDDSWALEMSEFVNDLQTGTKYSDNLDSSLEVLRVIGEIYSRTNR